MFAVHKRNYKFTLNSVESKKLLPLSYVKVVHVILEHLGRPAIVFTRNKEHSSFDTRCLIDT